MGCRIILTLFFWLQFSALFADVKLPAIFSDNMIIQQGKSVRIWGWAKPGEKVIVTLGCISNSTTADQSGNWSTIFAPLKASFDEIPFSVSGKNTITFKNVLVGEVWLCSGQSNMEWPLALADNGKEAVAQASHRYIRFFSVPHEPSAKPLKNCDATWQTCTPDTAANFPAVGYFLGMVLYKNLNVPIGLIGSCWGGTSIEAWTPMEYLKRVPSMVQRVKESEEFKYNIPAFEAYEKQLAPTLKEYAAVVAQCESQEQAKKYSNVKLDDSEWQTIMVPGTWESQGLDNYNGYVWFRKKVNIPHDWAGKDIILNLGPIDEIDVTWFNGMEVGRKGCALPQDTAYWNRSRHYNVPGMLVKTGENVIAIRVADTFREGGLWGKHADEIYCSPAEHGDKRISLAGKWKILPVGRLPDTLIDPRNPNISAKLYNGMIAPIAGFTMRGVIWYHGENNTERAYQYRKLMPLLIEAWRDKWHDEKMVFIQTQLANYKQKDPLPSESSWAELREAQLMSAQKDPLVGMAVIIDIGEADDIHPRNKQEVGKRLALQAEKIAYGKNVPFEGPVYKSIKIEGNKIRLGFESVFGGLVAKEGKLKGFAIAGTDRKFVWADAKIDNRAVIVWSDKVTEPVAVRYAWATNPQCTLYNTAGLPATPFRTDDWLGITVDEK